MGYSYKVERPKLFTDEGQRMLLKIRDKANHLLDEAGAVRMDKLFVAGDSWQSLACVDRLVELGEIREITDSNVMGQHRVFVRSK